MANKGYTYDKLQTLDIRISDLEKKVEIIEQEVAKLQLNTSDMQIDIKMLAHDKDIIYKEVLNVKNRV